MTPHLSGVRFFIAGMFFYVRCLAAGFLNNKVTTTNNVKPLDGVNLFLYFLRKIYP